MPRECQGIEWYVLFRMPKSLSPVLWVDKSGSQRIAGSQGQRCSRQVGAEKPYAEPWPRSNKRWIVAHTTNSRGPARKAGVGEDASLWMRQ
jgi:hypothetical protein